MYCSCRLIDLRVTALSVYMYCGGEPVVSLKIYASVAQLSCFLLYSGDKLITEAPALDLIRQVQLLQLRAQLSVCL